MRPYIHTHNTITTLVAWAFFFINDGSTIMLLLLMFGWLDDNNNDDDDDGPCPTINSSFERCGWRLNFVSLFLSPIFVCQSFKKNENHHRFLSLFHFHFLCFLCHFCPSSSFNRKEMLLLKIFIFFSLLSFTLSSSVDIGRCCCCWTTIGSGDDGGRINRMNGHFFLFSQNHHSNCCCCCCCCCCSMLTIMMMIIIYKWWSWDKLRQQKKNGWLHEY